MILFMSERKLREIIDQRAHRMVIAEEKCREFEDILKEMHREVMEGKSVEEYMRTAPRLRDILGMPSTTAKPNIKPPAQAATPSRDPWASNPDFPVEDWQDEVDSNDTRLGYLDWVEHQKESKTDHVVDGGKITYLAFLDANRTSFECFGTLWRSMPFHIKVEFAEKMYNTSSALQVLCERLATRIVKDDGDLLNRCLRILKAAKHEFAPHTTNSDADELIAELERRLSPKENHDPI